MIKILLHYSIKFISETDLDIFLYIIDTEYKEYSMFTCISF